MTAKPLPEEVCEAMDRWVEAELANHDDLTVASATKANTLHAEAVAAIQAAIAQAELAAATRIASLEAENQLLRDRMVAYTTDEEDYTAPRLAESIEDVRAIVEVGKHGEVRISAAEARRWLTAVAQARRAALEEAAKAALVWTGHNPRDMCENVQNAVADNIRALLEKP